jgi:ribokinase
VTAPRVRIAVVGSINMDRVIRCAKLPAPGQTVIGQSFVEVPGGKGANQAVAAARAGGRVAMIGRVGDDAMGDRLLENLRREGIDVASLSRLESSPSGFAVVAVEASGENQILVVPGANGKITRQDVQAAGETIRRADVLLVQLEIPLDTVAAAIEIANADDVPVILNPAPMPDPVAESAVAAKDDATEERRSTADPRNRLASLPAVDVICPNQSEAAAIVGRSIQSVDDAMAAADDVRTRVGARRVVITLGRHGAVVGEDQGVEWIRPFSVTAVDTTAAGDAFAGALAVRLAEGSSLVNAARFASAAGALAATRHGAIPALPSRDEIEPFLAAMIDSRS